MLLDKLINKRIERYQSELLQKYCDEVESMYRKMRGWRHDYHNHIQAMQASMALGNYDEVNRYLSDLNDDLTTVDTVIKTGRVMDFKREAQHRGAERDPRQREGENSRRHAGIGHRPLCHYRQSFGQRH